MIFNIMVDVVVRPTLEVVCGPQEVWYGMGWAEGERNLIFYADDRRIGGTDHIWIQDALMVSVLMFRRVVLETNLEKKKALVCTPVYIWCKWREAAYKSRATGGGRVSGRGSGRG